MAQANEHFVDPTIPGISGRDFVERAIRSVQATVGEIGYSYRSTRADFALRKGLARLDRRQLRDIGIDRDGA